MGNLIADCDPAADCESLFAEQCSGLANDDVIQSSLDATFDPVIKAAIGVSWFFSSAMAALIYFNKELHVHPMGLYGCACAMESSMFFMLLTGPVACTWKLP